MVGGTLLVAIENDSLTGELGHFSKKQERPQIWKEVQKEL
jgi:hypothetical protein